MNRKWWTLDKEEWVREGLIGLTVEEDEQDGGELEAMRVESLWYHIETHNGLNKFSFSQSTESDKIWLATCKDDKNSKVPRN